MVLNYTDIGQGPPLVLLHGMAGSLHYWDGLIPELSKSHRVIAIDLLGFGMSSKPKDTVYSYDSHLGAITDTLQSIGIDQPVTLVGHSTGALLVLKLASRLPKMVNKLILLSPPVYKSATEAKQDIVRESKPRELVYFGPSSQLLCFMWCKLLRPVTRHIAPLYLKGLPKRVAQDSLLHTWQSYSQTLDQIILKQDALSDMDGISVHTIVIYGDKESPVIINNIRSIKTGQNIHLQAVAGGHNLAISNKKRVLEIILASR